MFIKCQKCGKRLTDQESMRRGYGPECWAQISGGNVRSSALPTEADNVPGQMDFFDFQEIFPDEMGGSR